MPVKIAVVMTGHPRMVAYGHKLLQDDIRQLSNCEFTVFSNTWTSDSDIRKEFALQSYPDKHLLNTLTYHNSQDQVEFMDKLYDVYKIPAERIDFTNKAAQILGMIDALERWHDELTTYDYIIKNRWDQMLDTSVLRVLAREKHVGFYNKSVRVNEGRVEISGNTIYGDSESWFKHFSPKDKIMELIVKFLNENNNRSWPAHELLGYLFQYSNASITCMGEEFPIRSRVLQVPLSSVCKMDAIKLI
jgi:hypothetical protein